jgi:hypothetical protein
MAEHKLADTQSSRVLAELAASAAAATDEGLAGWWDAAGIDQRHEVLRPVVERVVVAPATKPGRFDPDRIRVIWRV